MKIKVSDEGAKYSMNIGEGDDAFKFVAERDLKAEGRVFHYSFKGDSVPESIRNMKCVLQLKSTVPVTPEAVMVEGLDLAKDIVITRMDEASKGRSILNDTMSRKPRPYDDLTTFGEKTHLEFYTDDPEAKGWEVHSEYLGDKGRDPIYKVSLMHDGKPVCVDSNVKGGKNGYEAVTSIRDRAVLDIARYGSMAGNMDRVQDYLSQHNIIKQDGSIGYRMRFGEMNSEYDISAKRVTDGRNVFYFELRDVQDGRLLTGFDHNVDLKHVVDSDIPKVIIRSGLQEASDNLYISLGNALQGKNSMDPSDLIGLKESTLAATQTISEYFSMEDMSRKDIHIMTGFDASGTMRPEDHARFMDQASKIADSNRLRNTGRLMQSMGQDDDIEEEDGPDFR